MIRDEDRERIVSGGPLHTRKSTYPTDELLEVVITVSSHDDLGWLYPFDEMYDTSVRNIFDHTLEGLQQFPDVKFMQGELAFFERWWSERPRNMKDEWKRWVSSAC